MYAELHHAVARLMPMDAFAVIAIDHAVQRADTAYLLGPNGRGPSARVSPIKSSVVGALLQYNASVRIDDIRAVPHTDLAHAVFREQQDLRSGVAVLLRGSAECSAWCMCRALRRPRTTTKIPTRLSY